MKWDMFEVEKIGDRFYVFHEVRSCNIGVCAKNGKAIVIDAGRLPEVSAALIRTIREKLGCQVEMLFITHYHSDHTFGGQSFDCPILASEECRNMMEKCLSTHWSDEEIEKAKEEEPTLAQAWKDLIIALPTCTFKERKELDFHGIKVVFEKLGGHSKDSSIAYFPDHKLIFCGDIIFGNRYPTLLQHDAEPFRLIEALNKIISTDAETIFPGHGDTGDKSIAKTMIEYWRCLTSKCKKLISAGVSENNAVEILVNNCHLAGIPFDKMRHKRNVVSIVGLMKDRPA